MTEIIELGSTTIVVTDDMVLTIFSNGRIAKAKRKEIPGQAQTASELGMSVSEMNRTHDLVHSLLCHWLGLPHSPTLFAVSVEDTYNNWRVEEKAVLAIQQFSRVLGLDLVQVAQKEARR